MKVLMALLILSSSAYAENCKTLADKAESTVAESAARAAIEACSREKVKTARPYLVMAVLANREKRFEDVIKWSEKALAQEPGLAVAYMDLCSAYSQMKKYDQAVSTCKKGLAKKSPWDAKLNFNIGLAIFQKAVDAAKIKETLKAEPYFKESQKLDPALAQNDFYLGNIEESAKVNLKAAAEHYEAGCRLGSTPSCESLARVKGPSEPASQEEEKLWASFEEAYRKKGLSPDLAKSNVGAVRKGMSHMTSAERMRALHGMLEQVQ